MKHDPIASPSSLGNLVLCPGRGKQCLDVKQDVTTYMEDGNEQHDLMKLCAENTIAGKPLPNIPAKYADAIKIALDHLNIVVALFSEKAKMLVETELDLSCVGITVGTIDFAIIDGERAAIIDYKFGQSYVDAPDYNYQTKCYAVGLKAKYPQIKEVMAYISQPNVYEEYQLKMGLYTEEILENAKTHISSIVAAAKADNPSLIPGTKQCQFCRAKLTCPARQEQTMIVPFGTVDIDAYLNSLTAIQVGELMSRAEFVQNYCKTIISKVTEKAINEGMEVDGYTVGDGRATNKFTADAAPVLERLADEAGLPRNIIYELVGITKANELFGKSKAVREELSKVTIKMPGEKKLKKNK